jgi:hypothetical protein
VPQQTTLPPAPKCDILNQIADAEFSAKALMT